jgi:tetratricopeptide (TPR) repeat protein
MSMRGMSLVFIATLMASVSGAAFAVAPSGGAPSGGGGGGGGDFGAPKRDPAADYRKGIEALQAGKFKDADRAFGSVLEAAPRDSNVWLLSGMAKAGNKDLKGAQRAYEKSVQYDDKNIDAHRELGVTYAKSNQGPKAQKELDALKAKSDACKDTCPDANKLKASINALQGAIGGGSSAELSRPSLMFASVAEGDNAYLAAVSLINEKRYDEALAALDTAKSVFGPHPDVLTYIGYTYRKMGQYDQAEKFYTEALSVAPNHKPATEYFGELKVERGDLAGAKKLLAKLDTLCTYACPEEQELRRWIDQAEKRS